MRRNAAILAAAMLAGSLPSAFSQAKVPTAPDPATVNRLQGEIARDEAKGDFQSAALELRLLARMYKNDPAMLSITYSQLVQVSTQLHDDRRAAEYRALAQGVSAQPVEAPAFTPQAAAVPAPNLQISAAPASTPQAPPPVAAPKASTTDKLSKIFAEAQQIMAQTKQMQQAMKQKKANAPQPDQPVAPQPDTFPTPPDGAAAVPDQPQQAPAEVSPAAGVVIGYDANNQPIFASPQPAPGTSGGQPSPPPQYPAPPR